MTTLSQLRQRADALRSRAAAAADELARISDDKHLSVDGKRERSRALNLALARDAHRLLPELQRAARAIAQRRRELVPQPPADVGEGLRAHRLLDQLRDRPAGELFRLASDPAVRRAVIVHGTALDREWAVRNMAGADLAEWERSLAAAASPRLVAEVDREAEQLDEALQTVVGIAGYSQLGRDLGVPLGAEGAVGDAQADASAQFWRRRVVGDVDLESDLSYTLSLQALDREAGAAVPSEDRAAAEVSS